MAEWVTSKSGDLVNLDALAQVKLRTIGGEYRVVGILPGPAEGGAREEIPFFVGSQKDCDAALFGIHRRLKPLNLG